MKKITQQLLLALLVLICIIACDKDDTQAIRILDDTRSELTLRLQENSTLIHRVYSDTTVELYPGVVETDIHYQDINGHTMRVFIVYIRGRYEPARYQITSVDT